MNTMMTFPKTIDEFIESYQFKDKEEIYTNGSELIQVFRVQQAIEHYLPKWISVKERLPEEDGEYLVVFGRNDKWGSSVDLRRFAKDMRKCFSVSEKFKRRPGWYFHDGEWGDVEDTTVEFWMLKPEPPEVEE